MRHTLHRTAAVALALTVMGAPAAVAKPAAIAKDSAGSWTPPRDMRSPDARDAADGGGTTAAPDMRSPDARDAAEGRGTFNSPEVVVVGGGRQRPAPVAENDGIDWADAGIGAGVLGGLVLLASGGVLVAHRRSAPAA